MIIWFAILTNFRDQAISTPDLVMATIPQEFVCGVKYLRRRGSGDPHKNFSQ